MEETDLELIKLHAKDNNPLDRLYKEHLRLEKEIDDLSAIRIKSPEDEKQIKNLKLEKLEGRDKMEKIFKTLR